MLEDQIFCKLLVRFLNLVINSDSDVHWLQREDGVHSRLKNCHWIGMVAGGLLLGCVGRGLDRQSKRNGRDTIQNWSTVINIWQNDGQKKRCRSLQDYSHCCQNCKINSKCCSKLSKPGSKTALKCAKVQPAALRAWDRHGETPKLRLGSIKVGEPRDTKSKETHGERWRK